MVSIMLLCVITNTVTGTSIMITVVERAEQCQKVLDANEEYDFCFFAGNSDEALSTHSGKPGAEDYSLRENMEKAVRILKKRAEEKHAKMVLWAPHAYQ